MIPLVQKRQFSFYRICGGGIPKLKGRMVQENLPKKSTESWGSLHATKRERRRFRGARGRGKDCHHTSDGDSRSVRVALGASPAGFERLRLWIIWSGLFLE